jgi:hypothetical protein
MVGAASAALLTSSTTQETESARIAKQRMALN